MTLFLIPHKGNIRYVPVQGQLVNRTENDSLVYRFHGIPSTGAQPYHRPAVHEINTRPPAKCG